MIIEPRHYTLDEEVLRDEFAMVSTSLPNVMTIEEVRNSKEYNNALDLLEKQMVEMGWVSKGNSYEESETLRDIHVDQIVDYTLKDDIYTIFLAAVVYKTSKPLFIER